MAIPAGLSRSSIPASSAAGGIAPILYGAIADHSRRTIGVLASAATAALIVPLVLMLRPLRNSTMDRKASA